MRKLPRRLPSNSPSLAWVAFAVLLLAIGGGLAGLYTHRQNQESTKLRLIGELKREVLVLNQRKESDEREISARKQAAQLKLVLQNRKINLQPISPEHRILVNVAAPSTTPEGGAPPATNPSNPSVMAVIAQP
jgi:hypothetical protein